MRPARHAWSPELTRQFGLEQGRPVAELITLAGRIGADLIVTGTHGRKGIERALLGSTAEGILRASSLVMVVREETNVLAIDKPVARVLVAVDNSGPADAALAVAAKLQRAYGTELILCSIADTRDLQDKSLLYGYLQSASDDRIDAGRCVKTIASALRRAGLPENSAQIVIAEGEPAAAIIKAATFHHAPMRSSWEHTAAAASSASSSAASPKASPAPARSR